MKCTNCNSGSKVWCLDTRPAPIGVRRRYECQGCKERFTTIETRAERSPKGKGGSLVHRINHVEHLLGAARKALDAGHTLVKELVK